MKNKEIKISPLVIWISSLLIGILSSVPQLASHQFNLAEALVNAALTSSFAVAMWYFNLLILNKNSNRRSKQRINYANLVTTLVFGLIVMFCLAWIQQLILSHINFGPTMLMVEVRGILINLVFFMFINLLQQNYQNQHVSLELEQIRHANLGAQYELLKQQVNPHFLFNSLNTLKAMVETNDKDTVDFVLKLSNFYRFTLESRKHDLIHLHEEMKILNDYLFLQNARFSGGFTFESRLDEQVLNSLIPPFTLQLLVENCLKHNVVSRSKPLNIVLYQEGETIVLENQIQRKKGENNSLGVGLSNIDLRYSHLLGKHIEISNDTSYFKIKLPIIDEYSNS